MGKKENPNAMVVATGQARSRVDGRVYPRDLKMCDVTVA